LKQSQHRWRVRRLLLHGAMVAAPLVLLFLQARTQVSTLGICLIKTLVGVPGPACGITHSAMAMFTGHTSEAFRLHPAGPVMVVLVVGMTLYLALVLMIPNRGLKWAQEVKTYKRMENAAIAALLIGWAVRPVIN
jgi:hypothetical protein